MNAWDSYRIQDFIPFSADVYFRLLARMSEFFWPLQLVTLAMGIAALVMALRGNGRVTLLLLAPVWAFVGVAFFAERYANLNWVGQGLGRIWLGQGALLVVLVFTRWGMPGRSTPVVGQTITGVLIALVGLLMFPLLALVVGGGWMRGEVFGLHPDPTAVVSLGLFLIVLRGWALWLASLVPLLWLGASALTLQVLGAPWWAALLAVMAAALGGMIGQSRAADGRGKG